MNKNKPNYPIGTKVEVIVNQNNRTYHKGTIDQTIWHFKDNRWNYYLKDENGKKIKKRYIKEDLRKI